jgi:hypothetical protein
MQKIATGTCCPRAPETVAKTCPLVSTAGDAECNAPRSSQQDRGFKVADGGSRKNVGHGTQVGAVNLYLTAGHGRCRQDAVKMRVSGCGLTRGLLLLERIGSRFIGYALIGLAFIVF